PRVVGSVAVLAGELLELVPGALLVGQVGAPLDVHQGALVAAARDRVAELERPPFRALVVVDPDLEARRLALDAPLGILAGAHGPLARAVVGEPRVARRVAVNGERRRRLGRDAELLGRVAQPRDADSGVDLVAGRHGLPRVGGQSRRLSDT